MPAERNPRPLDHGKVRIFREPVRVSGFVAGVLMIRSDLAHFTPLLRNGEDPLWVRIRGLLAEKGYDPSTLVLTWCYPDDVGLEMGEIVTPDLRAFEFEFRYEENAIEQGVFQVWREVTHLPKGQRHLHRNEIGAVRRRRKKRG